jgi:hypothetical protein
LHNWLGVGLGGLVGGFTVTLLPAGMDTKFPDPVQSYLDHHPAIFTIASLLRSVMFGVLAAILVWLGAGSRAGLNEQAVTPQLVDQRRRGRRGRWYSQRYLLLHGSTSREGDIESDSLHCFGSACKDTSGDQ